MAQELTQFFTFLVCLAMGYGQLQCPVSTSSKIGGAISTNTGHATCRRNQHCCAGGCCNAFVIPWQFWVSLVMVVLIIALFYWYAT